MCNNETLEILNIFTKAVNVAKARNTKEFTCEITESVALEMLKQAFPKNKNLINSLAITKNILNANQA